MSDSREKSIVDDAAKAAGTWIESPDNQKQVGGWIAQFWAWITGAKKT